MKSTDTFKKVISDQLLIMAEKDPLFAGKLNNKKKNIDDCITYILNRVQKSGCSGFTDDEIYGMAAHYYDEENIEVGKPISCNVVVNHKVEHREETKLTSNPENEEPEEDFEEEESDDDVTDELQTAVPVNRQSAIHSNQQTIFQQLNMF